MAIGIGIDSGSISIKAAVFADGADSEIIDILCAGGDYFEPELRDLDHSRRLALTEYRRIKGSPLDVFTEIYSNIQEIIGDRPSYAIVTGSGGKLVAGKTGFPLVNEFSAIATAVNTFFPHVRTVFEMGGETSKYILFGTTPDSENLSIVDYGTNGDCAAGTGSFMDQQASRLRFAIEDVGDIVDKAAKTAQIAGRCSVFAKSDMIHAQQRGYQPEEVLRGLCNAVARNFKSAISRGKRIVPPVAFIGGVAKNRGMVHALENVFDLAEGDLFVPETMCWFGAIGSAVRAIDETADAGGQSKAPVAIDEVHKSSPQLLLDNVRLLRSNVSDFKFPTDGSTVPAYLGIDIGSVSTNLVVIDADGNVIMEIYTPTKARPIEVVSDGLKQIQKEVGDRINIKGVGSTGSGRELIGILVGADTINDEITAHKTGALNISRKMLDRDVDTIFEIGGQDSKYISIEDGIVIDFTMNDACAAGTGSFLEEQAEDLDISIIDEFSRLALSSEHPVRMGERCTVFMGRDVNSYMQRGFLKKDVIAGLAYSVVHNYLNRVVRDRHIGTTIFFQGGTAYNDSVAAAFASVTGKEIIVPPHNGVIGAIGVALLAKRKMTALGTETMFHGFDIESIDYSLREFTCKGCSNFCTIQEFTVGDEKTYWGDKCSDRYRKRKRGVKIPVVEDLQKVYENHLFAGYAENGAAGPVIGLPLAMYNYELFPFFNTYLTECGFCTVKSDPTNTPIENKGLESVVAEPCYPITVAHGHVKSLLDRDVDFVWMPNIINSETEFPEKHSFVCVWGSTLPFILQHAPAFHNHRESFLSPTLYFRDGSRVVKNGLFEAVSRLGISRKLSDRAADAAYKAQREFRRKIEESGKNAIRAVKESEERAIVLVGRPYNIYDRAINISVASKLSSIYGINVIPMHFLGIEGIDIANVNDNMFWNYGKKILQVAAKLSMDKSFDIIYVTNFKCGPDSFIKQYVRSTLGRPFLVLQFDGHANDAGMMTRCEAYLDSKGFLGHREAHDG